jgi:hypothetical protein
MWLQRELPRAVNDDLQVLLQLKLDREETTLLGTSGNGFVVWEFGDGAHHPNEAVMLPLPHGVRNISTRVLCSNSCMVSAARDYIIAGVRLTNEHQIFNHTNIHFFMHSFTLERYRCNSHSRHTRFKAIPCYLLFWIRFYIIFLSPSRHKFQ